MDSANIIPQKERVIVYVDGFNLYFGLLESWEEEAVDSLFENEVVKKSGFILRKPKEWL